MQHLLTHTLEQVSDLVSVNGNGTFALIALSPTDLHVGASITGASLTLSGGEFDLTQVSLSGNQQLQVQADTIADVNTNTVRGFTTVAGSGQLHTSDTSLDLTGITSSVSIYSTNTAGTTFTTDNAQTASEIRGGSSNDTLIYTNATPLTDTQRADIFALGSVETIQDNSGTYTFHVTELTVQNDLIQGGSSDLTITGTASTLNSGDQLIGGTGHNTLALYGAGDF